MLFPHCSDCEAGQEPAPPLWVWINGRVVLDRAADLEASGTL